MTQVFFSQRALVEASMQLAPTTAERHGVYQFRNSQAHAGGPTHGQREGGAVRRPQTNLPDGGDPSHATRPMETGRDGRGASPTLCPRCHGDGEVTFRYDWLDPQTEDSEECRVCDGIGTVPVPRHVPETRRAA